MSRNIAQVGRRELVAHRRFVTGVTASVPQYVDADQDGNKEWVVDVYLGPLDPVSDGTLIGVPIASIARNLVTDIRQPVELERSREGKYTVIGRAKNLAAGLDIGGGVPTGTFVETRHNYADLGLRWFPDLDWEMEAYQLSGSEEYQADEDAPYQVVRAWNAFNRQVVGPPAEVPEETAPAAVQPVASSEALERRFRIRLAPYQAASDEPYQAAADEPYQAMVRSIEEVAA
ncbi:MAG TPA: hypothetical protein VJU16_04015 [Planctomycetota bacterium]|nr:hypothetical protein [Planctomycetota bacterium]